MKYYFVLKNEADRILAVSQIYTEESFTPDLNKNLARWISHGFPNCEGEDNGSGIIVPNDRIFVEYALD